ncbi:hypothetical protein ACSS6W_005183 [Trichoderma asperelloides]
MHEIYRLLLASVMKSIAAYSARRNLKPPHSHVRLPGSTTRNVRHEISRETP